MASQCPSSAKKAVGAVGPTSPANDSVDSSTNPHLSPASGTDTGNLATNSAAEDHVIRDHVIYPFDGHEISSITPLLAAYPPSADIRPHISKNFGVLYWVATISPAQARELELNEQVHGVYAKRRPEEIDEEEDDD